MIQNFASILTKGTLKLLYMFQNNIYPFKTILFSQSIFNAHI